MGQVPDRGATVWVAGAQGVRQRTDASRGP